MKVLIIGGVAGGASAAARLRRLDESAEIVILERTGFVSYANCGLPYYVGGVITEKGKLTLQTPQSFRNRFDVDVRVRNEAVSIDRDAKTVRVRRLDDGTEYDESYDVLILSPGAKPLMPEMPGTGDPRVMTMRTVEDTLAMRDFVVERKPRYAVVAGGGYIGLEVAENLANMGVMVTLVQRPDHVLPPLDRDMAADVHHCIRANGIDLLLSEAVTGFESAEDGLKVMLRSGRKLEADMAVVALGVVPESHLASEAGLETGIKGAIVTDTHMRTSDPSIYAVGDAVQVREFVSGTDAVISLAGPANRQGRSVADNIAGIPSSNGRKVLGASVVRVFGLTAASVGRNEKQLKRAGEKFLKVYAYPFSHATYYPGAAQMTLKLLFAPDGRVLGAQGVGADSVEKQMDVISTVMKFGGTVRDLAEVELCYAPPFNSAKSPVNMLGFIASNVLDGLMDVTCPEDVKEGDFVLDVRTPQEYAAGHIAGSVNIPLDELRERLGELPKDTAITVTCAVGLRGYIAARILAGHGFKALDLTGGYRMYATAKRAGIVKTAR